MTTAWLLVGFALGWFVNVMVTELRMRILTEYVRKTLKEMCQELHAEARLQAERRARFDEESA